MSTNTDSATEKPKLELVNAFQSATTIAGKLEAFQIMASASCFEHSELAAFCWYVTHTLVQLDLSYNAQQLFTFGKTALSISNKNLSDIHCFANFPSKLNIHNANDDDNTSRSHSSSLFVACVCYLLGISCYYLERYGESLCYLESADRNASALQDDNRCLKNCVRLVLLATHKQLHKVKVAMGKKDEAVVNARKVLEFMELTMNGNSSELCYAYKYAYEACVAALDAEQAIPLCLKALKICIGLHGGGSGVVTRLRVDLEVLYRVVGDSEKAARARELWTNTCDSSEFLKAEVKGATMLINLSKYEEAIEVLEVVVSRNDTKERGKVKSLLTMATASCMLEKFVGAVKYMKEVENIHEANNFDSIFVSAVCFKMSGLYEKMKDLETALSWSERAWKVLVNEEIHTEDHQKLLAESSQKLFSLISLAGRAKEDSQIMELMAEKLEEVSGLEHLGVGYSFAKLGDVLINSGQEDLALKWIKKATDIVNAALGPYHLDSLRTMHTLCEVYVNLER